MKKLFILGSALAISVALLESCGSTKKATAKTEESKCATGTAISYNVEVKSIIDNNCAGCHDASKKESIGDLTNYAGLKPYLESGRFEKLVLIRHSMPKGAKLSEADLNTLQCWKEGGFKE